MVGALAQLGEHLLCKQGVSGSIPLSSTNSLPREDDGVEMADTYPLKKYKFASTSVRCLFCIYREEKIDLEASRCFGTILMDCPRRPSPVPEKPWMA